MNSKMEQRLKLIAFLAFILILAACTAGDSQFSNDTPAGFWYGLWHGVISIISLIIHIFNQNVLVYEINNSGGWYDFGFLLGVIVVWGGASHASCKSKAQKQREKEWDEVCDKMELKIMRNLKDWAEDENNAESLKEWEEIGEKVEKKLKRKIREWAEKD